MARRGGRTFTRGVRRPVDWSASANQSAMVPVAAATAVLLESFTPIVGGETVIRTRGIFTWQTDQLIASEDQFGAVGMCVVTAQAVSVGISAIPHPATDAAWGGWLWHSFFASSWSFLSSTGVEANIQHQIIIDSKAMRKVDEDERLVMVCENTNATQGFLVANSERILSKVH